MSINTVFSGQATNLHQIRQAFLFMSEWSNAQNRDGWEKHGSYLTVPEEKGTLQFNFFVINTNGLTMEQKDTILQLLREANLHAPMALTDLRPAQ